MHACVHLCMYNVTGLLVQQNKLCNIIIIPTFYFLSCARVPPPSQFTTESNSGNFYIIGQK